MSDVSEVSARSVPHVRIEVFQSTAAYKPRRRKIEHVKIRENYASHAEQLLRALEAALPPLSSRDQDSRLALDGLKLGSLVRVETIDREGDTTTKIPTGFDFPSQEIVVLRSQRGERTEHALVFIPDDAREFLKSRIQAYGADTGNAERPDLERFERIEDVATTDGAALFSPPLAEQVPQPVWWEAWVREGAGFADQVADLARRHGKLEVHHDRLVFPEITVLLVLGTSDNLLKFVSRLPGALLEVRRAVDTIQVFMEERRPDGLLPRDHVEELNLRITPPPEDAPSVCILDSGVARAHPLVAKGLGGAWAVDEAWGTDDHHRDDGHGTGLATLALYGDLYGPMADQREIRLRHRVESVKYLSPPPSRVSIPSYGAITQAAASLAEINGGTGRRTFCIASSTHLVPSDRPSSWSGAIDQLCAGAMPGERGEEMTAAQTPKRLVLVAAGNMIGGQQHDVEAGGCIEDPAQSWNALTIGGYTAKNQIDPFELGTNPFGPTNDVSPFSLHSTSLPTDLTPIKPEVLFEAGNMYLDPTGFCGSHPSLSLLAGGRAVDQRPLIPFEATSAATAMAGHFSGRLEAELPGLWPETYRALMVHSADWTAPMRKRLIGTGASWRDTTKENRQAVIRKQGYGVPDFDRAVSSARNDLTLLAQSEIQPFVVSAAGGAVFNEVHFYDLPWPQETLAELFDRIVTMKVTLSYYIEPNLSGRAATRPDTYRSFGLRFALKKRTETNAQFKQRYGKALQEGTLPTAREKDYWLLGPNAISAGSLHCDLWRGQAAELAGHDSIVIFPVGGWWKTLVGKKRANDRARYALAISIDAREHEVDLAAEVQARVEAGLVEA
jgi:hypothetical protein